MHQGPGIDNNLYNHPQSVSVRHCVSKWICNDSGLDEAHSQLLIQQKPHFSGCSLTLAARAFFQGLLEQNREFPKAKSLAVIDSPFHTFRLSALQWLLVSL